MISFQILSHLRSNQRCFQLSMNLSQKYFKCFLNTNSFQFKNDIKINDCLKYQSFIANQMTIHEINGKTDPILSKLCPNKTGLPKNPKSQPINPILVPNLSYFEIRDKTKSNVIMDWERDVNPTKELPPTGAGVTMYLDYRIIRDPRSYTHLTVIRRRKMSKHKRRKWRRKMLAFLKKKYLKRNIKTEKLFRAELLAQIKEAEDFDAEKYVKNILDTIDKMPKPETSHQKFERIRELIRKNRRETNLIEPKFDD